MAPPSVPIMPPLLTAAPAAMPPAVPMVSAFVAQPLRPTSEATNAIPIPDLIMFLSMVEMNCTESIAPPSGATVSDGLLRLVSSHFLPGCGSFGAVARHLVRLPNGRPRTHPAGSPQAAGGERRA